MVHVASDLLSEVDQALSKALAHRPKAPDSFFLNEFKLVTGKISRRLPNMCH